MLIKGLGDNNTCKTILKVELPFVLKHHRNYNKKQQQQQQQRREERKNNEAKYFVEKETSKSRFQPRYYDNERRNIFEFGIDLIEFGIKMSHKYEDDIDSCAFEYDEDNLEEEEDKLAAMEEGKGEAEANDDKDEWDVDILIDDLKQEYNFLLDDMNKMKAKEDYCLVHNIGGGGGDGKDPLNCTGNSGDDIIAEKISQGAIELVMAVYKQTGEIGLDIRREVTANITAMKDECTNFKNDTDRNFDKVASSIESIKYSMQSFLMVLIVYFVVVSSSTHHRNHQAEVNYQEINELRQELVALKNANNAAAAAAAGSVPNINIQSASSNNYYATNNHPHQSSPIIDDDRGIPFDDDTTTKVTPPRQHYRQKKAFKSIATAPPPTEQVVKNKSILNGSGARRSDTAVKQYDDYHYDDEDNSTMTAEISYHHIIREQLGNNMKPHDLAELIHKLVEEKNIDDEAKKRAESIESLKRYVSKLLRTNHLQLVETKPKEEIQRRNEQLRTWKNNFVRTAKKQTSSLLQAHGDAIKFQTKKFRSLKNEFVNAFQKKYHHHFHHRNNTGRKIRIVDAYRNENFFVSVDDNTDTDTDTDTEDFDEEDSNEKEFISSSVTNDQQGTGSSSRSNNNKEILKLWKKRIIKEFQMMNEKQIFEKNNLQNNWTLNWMTS